MVWTNKAALGTERRDGSMDLREALRRRARREGIETNPCVPGLSGARVREMPSYDGGPSSLGDKIMSLILDLSNTEDFWKLKREIGSPEQETSNAHHLNHHGQNGNGLFSAKQGDFHQRKQRRLALWGDTCRHLFPIVRDRVIEAEVKLHMV